MKSKKFFALLTLSALLTLCLTAAAGAAMSDEEFIKLCREGTVQDIRSELLKGADVNVKDKEGCTALMAAVLFNKKNPEVISLLLKAGADVNAKAEGGDRKGMTALNGITALMAAAGGNTAEVVSLLLKSGADVNAKTIGGITALMAAAGGNTAEVVSLLLKAGADVNAKVELEDIKGITTLMAAARNNKNPEVVFLLLKAGADINAKDNKGRTALDYAREGGNDVAIKALEEVAAATDPEALYQLGIKYATGDGVGLDEKQGVELLRKAAELGHEKAKDALKLFE